MPVTLRRDISGFMVRHDPEMVLRAHAAGVWPDRTVAQFAEMRAREHPERVQLIDQDYELSCAELYGAACRLAGALVAGGIVPGDVIAFQLPNWWEASVITLAAAMMGAVINPIVPINRDAEVSYFLNAVAAKLVFIPESFRNFNYASMLDRIRPELASRPGVVLVRASGLHPGFEDFASLIANASALAAPRDVDPDAVKLVMFTSGTTGRSKGVLHSHNTIHADGLKMIPALGLSAADRTFNPSPVTHVTGCLWVLNVPWLADIPAVTVDVWEPARALDLLIRHRINFMLGATPFLQGLLGEARARNEHLPDLRQYLCGGAAVPPTLIYEAAEWFTNAIVWRNFGATEVPTMTRPPVSRADIRLGAETDGRLHGCDVKIADLASGEPLSVGEEGEILAREASMALGYLVTADNKAAYDEDGYFRMGDIGKLVEGEHVLVTGRKKDLIIRAGENISAKEIEDVLLAAPGIADAAVVAMPSRKTGEAVCAFIVADGDAKPGLASVTRLIAAAGLARQKTPEHVEIVAQLPRTASGKVRKDVLREQAACLAIELER
jgi:acyl-CoA synthetase (AMP-forming)/AMP-acid ligase II